MKKLELKRINAYPSFLKIAGVAGLFSLSVVLWSNQFVGVSFAVFLAIIAFLIVIWIIKRSITKDQENQKDIFAIVGYNYLREFKDTQNVPRREPAKVVGFVESVPISQYLSSKANLNAAIIGTSGSGKTELTYHIIRHLEKINSDGTVTHLKRVIFQFKPSDKYNQLGYPTLMLRDSIPNVFKDPDAFVQSWITAFPIGNIGITAGKIPILIRSILNRASNFSEFSKVLEDMIKKARDDITISALQDIRDKILLIERNKMIDFELPDEVVLDFEGLSSTSFVFFAEYILRQIYKEILQGSREGTILMIDEVSLFAQSGHTIIPEIAKLVRSRGALLVGAQSLSSITGDILDNCDSTFVSIQSGSANLREVEAISSLFHYSVTQLDRYEFVDLRQRNNDKEIYVFKLLNPSNQFYPVRLIEPNEEHEKIGATEKIDLEREVEQILTKEATNIQGLAKKLCVLNRKPTDKESIDYFKVRVQPILVKMARDGRVESAFTEGVKVTTNGIFEVNEKVYFWKDAKESYHKYLMNETEEILKAFDIKFQELSQGKSTADIESDDFVIEVETGMKHSTDDLEQRVKNYKADGKVVVIIVPNKELKQRYPEGMAPKEFKKWIERLKQVAIKKEEVK